MDDWNDAEMLIDARARASHLINLHDDSPRAWDYCGTGQSSQSVNLL
jgi:hypothetical protein